MIQDEKMVVDIKMMSPERLKAAGERLTRDIVKCGYRGDIECIGLLQSMLSATGADPVKIYNEVKAEKTISLQKCFKPKA